MRLVRGAVYVIGFAVALGATYWWAHARHHPGLIDGDHRGFIVVTGLIYWPLAVTSWLLVYPADERGMPWDMRATEPNPDDHRL